MAETPKPEIPNAVRERLAALGAAGEAHPDADLLAAFAERKLRAREREQVLAHLGVCAECRDVLARAQPAEAELETHAVTPAERSRWLRWEHLQWGALAAVLIVGAAVLVRAPWMRRDVPPEVQVAQSEAPVPAQPERQEEAAKPSSVAVNGRVESQTAASEPGKLADLQDREFDRIKPAEAQRKVAQEEAPRLAAAAPESKDDSRARERAASAPAAGREGVGPDTGGGIGSGSGAGVGPGTRAGVVGGALSSQIAPQAPAAAPPPRDKGEVAQSRENEMVIAESRADRPASDEKEAAAKTKTEAAYQPPAALPMKKHAAAGNVTNYQVSARTAMARWTVTSEGQVQRSLDGGKTWQDVRIASPMRFRAVAVMGANVWAGGSHLGLYYSADGGETWQPRSLVPPRTSLMTPAEVAELPDIVRIDFRDLQHGTVETSDGIVWITEDGGKTWRRK